MVTGAASGIGLALSHAFAARGLHVVMADVEANALDAAAEAVGATPGPGEVLAARTDVRDPDALDALAAATYERFGTAHIICNNAGVATGGPAWSIPAERWRWIVDVNLLGVAYGVNAFVPRMVEQGTGHVVNTASAAGLMVGPGMAPYYATKHAVVALSESLHHDLQMGGITGVGVSVLCPEWVRTRIGESERNLPEGIASMAEATDPSSTFLRDMVLGLVAGGSDPAEIAALVLDAIEANQFYVVPHAETSLPRARSRWDTIEALGQPTLKL